MRFYDAHNHLQADRLQPYLDLILPSLGPAGIVKMVVNGTSEADWPQVLALARQVPQVLSSFGYHPWHLHEHTPDWQKKLIHFLDEIPSAVGEIGLDRWMKNPQVALQEE